MFTGIVIGGFADEELFPTLTYCEIDGVYFDNLKYLSGQFIDINRRGDRAAIVTFAQQEMAERFIYGLDASLQADVIKFVDEAPNSILKLKPDAFNDNEVAIINKEVSEKFIEMIDSLKNSAKESILDIVTFMSKKELSELSHALVELTSKKRRFSAEQETVGGPIDVAVITRNEGFIWIQRKHYFEPALNQNYLSRIGKKGDRGHVGEPKSSAKAKPKPKPKAKRAAARNPR